MASRRVSSQAHEGGAGSRSLQLSPEDRPAKRQRDHYTTYTPEIGRAIADAYAAGLTVTKIADSLKIDRQTLYNWRKEKPDLKALMDEAIASRLKDLLKLVQQAADGSSGQRPDWRAAAWLHDRIDPELRAAQMAKGQPAQIDPANASGPVLDETFLAELNKEAGRFVGGKN